MEYRGHGGENGSLLNSGWIEREARLATTTQKKVARTANCGGGKFL